MMTEMKLVPETLDLLHVASASRRLGVTRQTVLAFIAHGQLTRHEIDGRLFLSRAEVERLGSERAARNAKLA